MTSDAPTSSNELPVASEPALPAEIPPERVAQDAAEVIAPADAPRTKQILEAFHEETSLGKAYDARLIKRLWPFVQPYRKLLILSLFMTGVIAAGTLARPLVMLETIDKGVLAGNGAVLLRGGFLLGAIVIAEQLLLFVQIYTVQIVGARAMADLRRRVFAFLHGLPLSFFDRQPVGRLVTRVTNDVDAILELFASGALSAFGDLIRLVGIVSLMVALDWKLALIGFAAAPPMALIVSALRPPMRQAYRVIRAKTARMNANMNEQVTGMSVVQAFNRQDAAGREFDEINAAYRDANIRSIKYEAMQDAAIETVSSICMASLIVALGYHSVSFGTLVAFSAYLGQFFEPIAMLAQRYTLLQSAMAGAERVFGLLDLADRDAPAKQASASADPKFAFELDHVSFGYKANAQVLHDVTIHAERGEKIALVGPTGSGKTTIASLLLRLYELSSGVVRVNGADIAGLDRKTLRQTFAVVPQDVFLFPGSIARNVAAGDEPDRARVEAALRRVGALDLILLRDGGIDARVEEHGSNFSAGERQLIAFARALYRDAPILILDEATASVDSDTEARLQHAVGELMRGRTALIIAHRLSTIRAADRIVVLHKGRVVEAGSHDQLLRAGGLYAKLHELQFAREASAESSPMAAVS
jgi:ATP-binding cassette, subfamily B, multidrug efflux pump